MSAGGITGAGMRAYEQEMRAGFDALQVLSRRGDRMVVRLRAADGRRLIVKMWARSHWRGALRRGLRIGPADMECRAMLLLEKAGVAAPRPLGVLRLRRGLRGYTEALFMEDLGPCVEAMDFVKGLLLQEDERGLRAFEDAVIELTAAMVGAGLLDADHGMLNIVVPPSGAPVRLDLELTRRVWWPALWPRPYGAMLGRLIGLHAFTVQPDVARTRRFAQRLRERIDPPRPVLRIAARHVEEMMARQRREIGLDTRLQLPWE